MQAATDRRVDDGARVPLDLWIRLAHEDYEDTFDADGVDISAGGLALRSEYLPEVGDRLRCRFDCPPTGDEIEIDGEVVWAHDAGERKGEFGLSFGRLADQVQDSLRQLVTELGGEAGTVARLHLDGVMTPIEAEILERDPEWLTVEQELPFLEIGMGVTIENGGGAPRGRLASVDLRIENGTPRLVLSVELDRLDGKAFDDDEAFDEDEEAFDRDDGGLIDGRSVQTLDEPDEALFAAEELEASDATMQDEELPEELRGAIDEGTPFERDEVKVFAIEAQDGAHRQRDDREAITPGDLMAEPVDRLEALRVQLGVFARAAHESLGEARQKAKPALTAFWAKLVAFFGMLRDKGGPRAVAFLAKAQELGSRVKLRPAKRRTTAVPRKRIAGAPLRRKQHAEAEPTPRRSGRRIAALSALAFAGVGAGAYALAFDGEEPPAAEQPVAAVVSPPASAPAPQPAPAPEAAEALIEPPVEAPAPAEEVAPPEPEGGPLAEPSYPTLRDATASGPVSEGLWFGAASVADGRTATIRMSQPVTSLRGTRQEDGFSVTVPGALSLDPAGPIAAANPSVERAMILNRGDHAVLTVRFVAGRRPSYRVVARGRAIEISIGR